MKKLFTFILALMVGTGTLFAAEVIASGTSGSTRNGILNCTDCGEVIASGTCGSTLSWFLNDEGLLIIGGGSTAGQMKNWDDFGKTPWYEYRDQITAVVADPGVMTIGDYAFAGLTNAKKVTISKSIVSIGECAFYGCKNVFSVEIPNSVKSIGRRAFDGCSGMTSLTLSDNLTSIQAFVFNRCESLTQVTIPNSVKSLGDFAFMECHSLTKVTIPYSVTSIGNRAFSDCNSLKYLFVPSSVTSMGYAPFSGNTSLPDIIVDAGNKKYCSVDGVLFNKSQTELIQYPAGKVGAYTIHEGVKSIGRNAFDGCSGLTSIEIPKSVTDINENAFYHCSGLNSIICNAVVPPTCKEEAFTGVKKNIPVYVPEGSEEAYKDATEWKDFTNIQAYCITGSGQCGPKLMWTLSCDGELTISGSGEMANWDKQEDVPWYSQRGSITSLVIESNIKTIGMYAFAGCNITSIVIPSGVTSIGNYAFNGCIALSSVTIPNSVTGIGNRAFNGCSALISVSVSSSVTSIGYNAFFSCNSLTAIDVDAANPNYCSVDGILFNKAKTELIKYPRAKKGASYTIPYGVTGIRNNAFDECVNLTSVVIPNSVTVLEENAFRLCSNLKSVTIGDGVTSMDRWAFAGCTGLNSIICKAAVPPVCGTYCFGNVKMNIPVYVPEEGVEAYKDAKGWKDFTDFHTFVHGSGTCGADGDNLIWDLTDGLLLISGKGKMHDWGSASQTPWYSKASSITSIVLESGVTSIGKYAFGGCEALTSVSIPNSVTAIGYGAFNQCTALTAFDVDADNPNYSTVDGILFSKDKTNLIRYPGAKEGDYTIPKSVTSIGSCAFENCKSLTSVTIRDGVTEIGEWAFAYCSGLTSITCHALTPPVCGVNCFNFPKKGIPVYVPAQSVDLYADAERWKDFTNFWPIAEFPLNGECGAEGDNLTWTLDNDGRLTITGSGAMAEWKDVNEIPWYVYRSYIQSVLIESGVGSISEIAFNACRSLLNISVAYGNTAYNSQLGVLYNNDFTCLLQCPPAKESYTFLSSVTSVRPSAFDGCKKSFTVTCESSTPPALTGGSDLFANAEGKVIVYVPEAEISAYEVAWGTTNCQYKGLLNGQCTVDGILYAYHSDGTASVLPKTPKYAGDIVVPESFTYNDKTYKVTMIELAAFSYCPELTSVSLPNTLEKIGTSFNSSPLLTTITIPENVAYVSFSAFMNCTGLKSIHFKPYHAVPSTGAAYFLSIPEDMLIYVPVVLLDEYKARWNEMTNIQPEPIEVNGLYYSIDTDKLNATVLPHPKGDGGYDPLVNITVPEAIEVYDMTFSVDTIGEEAFRYCEDILSVSLPNSLVCIDGYAFYNCTAMTEVNIPDGVTSIGDRAFMECKKMSSFTIPAHVATIGSYAFASCSGLTSITSDALNPPACGTNCFRNVDKDIPVYVHAQSLEDYAQAKEWKDFTNIKFITELPASGICGKDGDNLTWTLDVDGVLTISGTGEMADWTYGTSVWEPYADLINAVTISATVESIGDYAFHNCVDLMMVEIPAIVKTIGDYAFANCDALTEITCRAVTPPHCGTDCFKDVKHKISVYVPFISLTVYKQDEVWSVFDNIKPIAELPVNGICGKDAEGNLADNLTWTLMEDGVLTISGTGEMADYIDDDLSWKAFSHAITSVVIESGVTTIGDYAFNDCPLINEVTIPATVGSIGDYAFYGNQVLDLVEIPNSVKTIGEYAFSDCFELAWLFIGPDVTDIGQHAFDGCDALAMITSFAIIPPHCGNECFKYVNRDIPVYVPAKSVQAYKDADVWKEFDIQPLPLCTVTWRNWDGSLLAEEQYEYNIYDLPSYKGDQPIRPATTEYTYTFTGWTPEIEPLTDDVTYTAVYQQNFRRYNVAFLDWDGTTLYEAEYYYDETPEYPFGNPDRQSTAQYDFTFTGWSPQIENVSADQSYTALYEQTLRTYTVAFLDWDGTTLYVNEYDYGNIPEYPYDDPERESTVATTFTFAGWTPEISKVTDDATYTALYNATAQTYTVTWKMDDGTIIAEQTYAYDDMPEYPDPEKESTEQYDYTFIAWTPSIVPVTGDATYTANFGESLRTYTVTFLDKDGKVIEVQDVPYGEAAVAPEAPEVDGYTFTGWDKQFDNVTGDLTVNAQYKLNPGTGLEPSINPSFHQSIIHKLLRNGQIVILYNGTMYNVQGQRLN